MTLPAISVCKREKMEMEAIDSYEWERERLSRIVALTYIVDDTCIT